MWLSSRRQEERKAAFRGLPGVSAPSFGALSGLSAQQAVPLPWALLAELADLAGKRLRFRIRGPAWPPRLLCLRPAGQLVARKPVGCPFTAESHWVWHEHQRNSVFFWEVSLSSDKEGKAIKHWFSGFLFRW